jgi:uncharacterized membrane-anchored protein
MEMASMMGLSVRAAWASVLASAIFVASSASAVSSDPDPGASAPAAAASAEPENLPWREGPLKQDLGHQVTLDLPSGFAYLGLPEAAKLMEKNGNLYNDNLLGLVVSTADEDDYFVTLRYDDDGHVKDDEEVDGKELLKSIQEGEDEYNEERKKHGFPAIHADSWFSDPSYDKAKHQLVWGLVVKDSEGESLNYNTRILGRTGYVSLNLVTDRAHLAHDKAAGATLLGVTTFTKGAAYEDFNEKSDKVAEYGLTGLVLGGVGLGLAKAAKIGLLAKFGKVIIAGLIAGKKLIAVGIAGAAMWLKKLFGKKAPEAG